MEVTLFLYDLYSYSDTNSALYWRYNSLFRRIEVSGPAVIQGFLSRLLEIVLVLT